MLPVAAATGGADKARSRVPLFVLLLLLLLITVGLVFFTSRFLELDRVNHLHLTWTNKNAAEATAREQQQQPHVTPIATLAITRPPSTPPPPPPPLTPLPADGPLSKYLAQHAAFPVVVLCHDRASELKDTLQALLPQTKPSMALVLQDGADASVQSVAKSFGLALKSRRTLRDVGGGQQIAMHYGWSLREAFAHFADAPAVIVLEDDLTPSPDFMDWFVSASPLLDVDDSLFCVSAWNDNGFKDLVKDPYGVRRTLFFPGLGWLLTRSFWETKLAPSWPNDHWDWYVRGDTMRASRECVVPEMPRVFHAGKRGTFVDAQLQARYFDKIHFNKDASLSWKSSPEARRNLAGVPLQAYNARITRLIETGLVVDSLESFSRTVERGRKEGKPVVLFYRADPNPAVEDRLLGFCAYFGIWHQIIRASHEAVHEIYHKGAALLLINVVEPRPVQSVWFTPYPHQSIFATYATHVFDANTFTAVVDQRDASNLHKLTGNKGESCTQVCARMGAGQCIVSALASINSCSALRAAFACRDCRTSEGPDQPAVEEGGMCLVNHGMGFTCEGAHPSTRRLCACGDAS